METRSGQVTHIFQNILLCLTDKKETRTGLEQNQGKYMMTISFLAFLGKVPFSQSCQTTSEDLAVVWTTVRAFVLTIHFHCLKKGTMNIPLPLVVSRGKKVTQFNNMST